MEPGRTVARDQRRRPVVPPRHQKGGLEEINLGKIAEINNDHLISPDGGTVYVSSQDGHIYAVDLETPEGVQRTPRRVTNNNGANVKHYLHGVSPDGQWIYFNSERGSTEPGHAQLFRIPAPGYPTENAEPEQLTFDERVNWFPHPSPDGTKIAYVSFPPGTVGHPENVDVIVRVLGDDGVITNLVGLCGGQGTMNVPSWDPGGKKIAVVAYPL